MDNIAPRHGSGLYALTGCGVRKLLHFYECVVTRWRIACCLDATVVRLTFGKIKWWPPVGHDDALPAHLHRDRPVFGLHRRCERIIGDVPGFRFRGSWPDVSPALFLQLDDPDH